MKNFNIVGFHGKSRVLGWWWWGGGEVHEKPIYRGEQPKNWGLEQFPNLRGEGVFEGV